MPGLDVRAHALAVAPDPLLSMSGLVAAWTFDDASTLAADTSGTRILTNENSAAFTASGKRGGGLRLSGNGAYLSARVGTEVQSLADWGIPLGTGRSSQNRNFTGISALFYHTLIEFFCPLRIRTLHFLSRFQVKSLHSSQRTFGLLCTRMFNHDFGI